MDAIYPNHLQKLLEPQVGFAISIYMPTHPVGPQDPDDVVRLKNLVSTARHKLIEYGRRPSDVQKTLEAVENLPRDEAFWRRRSRSLAMFLSDSTFQRFRLGTPVEEKVIVNRRFHIKQLLPAVTSDGWFFILAMSQNRVRFLTATPHACEVMAIEGLPENIDQALNLAGAERGQQVHSGMHGALGKQAAVFHGQGGRPDTIKDELLQYFRKIDAAIRPVLRETQAPLILATVRHEAALFREVCAYPHLAEDVLAGNFDYATEQELHSQALPIAMRVFAAKQEEAAARYRELAGTAKASDRLDVVLPAALQGRVELLLVDSHAVDRGVFDPITGFISYAPKKGLETEDLIDRTAVESLLHRGNVYAVPREAMPSNSPVAAIFRY